MVRRLLDRKWGSWVRFAGSSSGGGKARSARMNIEESCPLNGATAAKAAPGGQPWRNVATKGASWAGFIILLAGAAAVLWDLTESSPARSSGLQAAEDKRVRDFHSWFVDSGSNRTIAEHLGKLTSRSHVAGTPGDMVAAEYVLRTFRQYGIAAHAVDYEVLLSYPLARSLALTNSADSRIHRQFALSEEENNNNNSHKLEEDDIIPPFHAYAPSGAVSGEAVYVNYGRPQDYRKLAQMGVNVSGAVVIARYGKLYRGTVVRIASRAGAVAAILYSDPQQFGGNGLEGFFPESKWMPLGAVQRGTVLQGIGDPTTAGWASTKHAERLPMTDKDLLQKFPSIPSLPISANEATHILMAISGPPAPSTWRGSLNVDYRLGRGPGILNFRYAENRTMATIRNVFAVIKGSEESDRFVLLGNHRDAWTYGAVDPNSGTAALLDIARRFGAMLRQGWRPRRSIILCSWDAEEYGMIGSTEWVEQNFDNLGVKAVAYLNVDCAVQGPGFFAGATPQLDNLLIEVTKKIRDPDLMHETIYDSWISTDTGIKIDRLGGGGSDFVAFLQHVGVPTVDMFYGEDYPVYHTRYDSFNWIKKFGDPYFHRHLAISAIWGLLALRLVDDHILPFEYLTYVSELETYSKMVQERINTSKGITIEPITLAIKDFSNAANKAAQEAKALRRHKMVDAQSILWRRAFNDRLILTERAFLDWKGLKGRSWFKHMVYAPSGNDEANFSSFPGVVDAIVKAQTRPSRERNREVQHEIWRVARKISGAAAVLNGEFT